VRPARDVGVWMVLLKRAAWVAVLSVLLGLLGAAGAQARAKAAASIPWAACADAEGYECASVEFPRDYKRPNGRTVSIAVVRQPAKDQANRLGSLFVNPGGPGGSGVDFVKGSPGLFASLNERYDIVGFDPRGTGSSTSAIDCEANQFTEGVYSQPYATPDTDRAEYLQRVRTYTQKCVRNNPGILPYTTTASVARDLDGLRALVGDEKLNYLGFSYGTFLGATYLSLFPDRIGRTVLDGPIDADEYINDPMSNLAEQTAAFERALQRFFMACAADQEACLGFGGDDPHLAYDALIRAADAAPVPAGDAGPAVTGQDMLNATIITLYAKQNWPLLAQALATAQAGDGTLMRLLTDATYGYDRETGRFDPGTDRYFAIGAAEQRYPTDPATYFRACRRSWGSFDHFWFNAGYVELNWGLFPVQGRPVYRGPFDVPASAQTPLVVDTTYDPATPYRGGVRLAKDLGNARLLTMDGDGHTAYNGNSACIDEAVEAYFEAGTLPAEGTRCRQEVPFAQEAAKQRAAGASAAERIKRLRPHQKPRVP